MNDLIDSEKMNSNTLELNKTNFNMFQVIDTVFSNLVFSNCGKRNVSFHLHFEKAKSSIFSHVYNDKKRFERILKTYV